MKKMSIISKIIEALYVTCESMDLELIYHLSFIKCGRLILSGTKNTWKW